MLEIDEFSELEKEFINSNFLINIYKISIVVFGIGLIISLFSVITFEETSSDIWGAAMADGYRMALNLFCSLFFGIMTIISFLLFLYNREN